MWRLAKAIAALIAAIFASCVALFLFTSGDYRVAALVTEDPALPAVAINGVRLHARTAEGPAGARTIIVLHGGPGGDFRSLLALEALSDSYRIVFYDQRGAGLSERVPAEMLTLQDHIEELDGIIDAFAGYRRPVLIGHSWGAMLATAYLGARPDAVAGAVLIEPGFLDSAGRTVWKRRRDSFMSGLPYLREALLNGFRAAHVAGPDAAAREDFLIGRMVQVFASHPWNPYHCGEGYTAPSWRFGAEAGRMLDRIGTEALDAMGAGARTFSGEVLLLAGDCNDWTGADLQKAHAERFVRARLAVIPDAGHDMIWDNPEAALPVIRDYLAQIGDGD